MFRTLKTLVVGANARAEEKLRDEYSIELIDQKIREAAQSLKAAKLSLANMIQQQRAEQRQLDDLKGRIDDLLTRAKEALSAGREDLAQSATQAVADLENESITRQHTVDRFDLRILQLRQSIETANRRLIDLKQGALSARAVRREQGMQKRLNRHLGGDSPMDEAQELIAGVLQAQDPFEQSQILAEIDQGLDHTNIAARMEEAGFGDKTRSTAADVLGRLKD
ncbi:PspA/IM30 family protein [Tropicibacter sp. Alg240-R139]|uniref:PspA/IM30 family protein n=1 Tax=Tropicibacter sp. Alg240-R139 TaxID=2305991 RepID=UPI0013E0DA5E|nr:PspA/IM30 family protein [Tropicibacter sp. Alg240-R139]